MLFDRDIEPCCSYCLYGTGIGDNLVACKKRGIMAEDGSCGAFRYEPTKREPEVSPDFMASDLTEEDFSL